MSLNFIQVVCIGVSELYQIFDFCETTGDTSAPPPVVSLFSKISKLVHMDPELPPEPLEPKFYQIFQHVDVLLQNFLQKFWKFWYDPVSGEPLGPVQAGLRANEAKSMKNRKISKKVEKKINQKNGSKSVKMNIRRPRKRKF